MTEIVKSDQRFQGGWRTFFTCRSCASVTRVPTGSDGLLRGYEQQRIIIHKLRARCASLEADLATVRAERQAMRGSTAPLARGAAPVASPRRPARAAQGFAPHPRRETAVTEPNEHDSPKPHGQPKGGGADAPPTAEKTSALPQARRSGSEKRQRQYVVRLRMTAEEHAAVIEAADRAGLTVGSYVRAKALGGKPLRAVPSPGIDRQLLAGTLGQIGKVASNLNQIARASNAGAAANAAELKTALDELTELRALLFQALGREP